MSQPKDRYEEYLESQIASLENEKQKIDGEINGLYTALATYRSMKHDLQSPGNSAT